MVREDDGILSVFPRLSKAFDICIKVKTQLVRDICRILYLYSLNKTSNDNRMLWKQRRLFSRKCTVQIHEVMVNNAYKNYLSLHFSIGSSQTARVKMFWNSSEADNCFETIAQAVRTDDNFLQTDNPSRSKGWQFPEPFERMTIFSKG